MSIAKELQRRSDELWDYWEGLGARVNSVPDVERIALRELMAKYIGQGKPEAVVPLVLAADFDDHLSDVDTLATALAEKGQFKSACRLWDQVLGKLEKTFVKGLQAHQRSQGKNDGDESRSISARVELCEAPRVMLSRGFTHYLNLFACFAEDRDAKAREQVRDRFARVLAAAVPTVKIVADARDMSEDVFWQLVEEVGRAGKSTDERVEALTSRLKGFRPKEILRFGKTVRELVREAYSWDLWGAAYLLNGGSSDDGFLYFCGWLILQGKERFTAAVRDPESMASWVRPSEDDPAEAEELLSLAAEIYEELTGKDAPDSANVSVGKPRGKRWKEDELPARLPQLWRRLHKGRASR